MFIIKVFTIKGKETHHILILIKFKENAKICSLHILYNKYTNKQCKTFNTNKSFGEHTVKVRGQMRGMVRKSVSNKYVLVSKMGQFVNLIC